nr:RecName: Full=Cuticle protein 30; AltName: Full=LM-ACP 30; Short=LM-30 [Locusta migratoria]
GLLGLGYGGY